MALVKGRSAITQLTASGTSTPLDVSASYTQTLYISHSNGTGTVTTAGSVQVQVQPSGSSRWYNYGGPIQFSTTAAIVDSYAVALRDDTTGVQLVYTAPAGATGYTLDAEVGTDTSM